MKGADLVECVLRLDPGGDIHGDPPQNPVARLAQDREPEDQPLPESAVFAGHGLDDLGHAARGEYAAVVLHGGGGDLRGEPFVVAFAVEQGGAHAEELLAPAVHEKVAALMILDEHHAGAVVHKSLKRLPFLAPGLVAFREAPQGVLKVDRVEFVLREPGQVLQNRRLVGAELPGPVVRHAQCADPLAVGALERVRGVKTHRSFPEDDRASRKAGVRSGVGYHERFLAENRLGAHGDGARRLEGYIPDTGLHPVALGVDKGDLCDGRSQQPRSHPGDAVEAFFAGGVEDLERGERRQPFLF